MIWTSELTKWKNSRKSLKKGGYMMILSWFNLVEYTKTELLVFGAGCLFWFIAYMDIIRRVFLKKFVEMPVAMVCANIAWEFLWGFVFRTNMGDFFVWAYRGWFFFDLFILWGAYRYGIKQITLPGIQNYFTLILTFCLVSCFVLLYFFIGRHDDPIGALSAYIINAITSVIYIPMVLRLTEIKNISSLVAWTKMLGTGMVSVFVILHWPEDYTLLSLAGFVFIVDIIYILILHQKKRNSGAVSAG